MKDHCPFCGEDREDYLCPSCEQVFENTEFKDECPDFEDECPDCGKAISEVYKQNYFSGIL